jgi:hypothetical protein
MKTLHRLGAVGAVLCATVALAAPAAQADSIAYVKDGNVHLSTPDGSRTFQVTDRGGYADVSQADDGTMIALAGTRLHRLDRMGTVLADFATPVSGVPGNASGFTGPLNPAISPDGTKVAYTYFWNTQSQNSTCYPPTCYTAINEGGTGYSYADRLTGWDEPGLGKHSGWLFPAWVDNDNLLLSFPTHAFNHDVITDTLSDSDKLVHGWFTDAVENNPGVGAGDVTRDRRKLAFLTGQGDSTLTLYHVPKFPTAYKDGEAPADTRPSVCYRYSGPEGGRWSAPTFSPDGSKLAMADASGIKVVSVPGFENGCSTDGATPTAPLVIAGGSEPDWGPADVPAGRPRQDDKGTDHDGPNDGPGAGLTATAAKTNLRAALRRGLKLTVAVPADGALSATAKAGGRTVAKAAAKQVAAGTRTVTLKFTKAARRALKRKASVRLSVTVKAGAQTTTLTARLKR